MELDSWIIPGFVPELRINKKAPVLTELREKNEQLQNGFSSFSFQNDDY